MWYLHNYDWLCHLATLILMVQKGDQVTKPIIVVNTPYKILYVIQVKGILINNFNFLDLLNIKVFVPFTMLFYSQAV